MGNGGQNTQASKEKTPTVEISHIDFIVGYKRWIIGNCDLMVHIHQLKPPMVRSRICSNYNNQRKLYMKLCPEVVDRPTNRKFVRLIFDPSGHFPNSRSSSFQAGENDADQP